MTTFAEEVYNEIKAAQPGAQRMLYDVQYTLAYVDDKRRWFAPGGLRTLTDVGMYEATINAY